jgi:secreted PhoX family phosphatase
MFVASTSENLVLRIELRGERAFVTNFVKEGVNVVGLANPDNLAIDNQGTLYITEDNGPGDIWAVPRAGRPARVASEVVRFASLSDCAAEPTGLYFDRNGKTAWVHVQHAGGALGNDLLLEIRKTKD